MLSLIFLVTISSAAQVPASWECDDGLFADGTCDCGCGAPDDDCDSDNFSACQRDNCPPGQAPWEHENHSCMTSTCGDGWKAADEACDDFDGLASGGCNADCSAVNPGFQCGEGAEGCVEGAEGEGEGEGEAEGEGEGGCAAVPASVVVALVPLALFSRRRRSR